MFRKIVWILAALFLIALPGSAQTPAPSAPKRPAPTVPARPARAPEIPEVPDLPELPALPALPDLSALSALSALPNLPGIELDELSAALQEKGERAQERAERAKEKAERDRERAEEQREREREKEQERVEREEELYDDGTEAMDEGQWDKAVEKFKQLAAMKGKKADAALYWQAYALNKVGRTAEAITTLAELQKNYPKSSYLKDARALEIEVRRGGSQPPVSSSGTGPGQTPKLAGEEDCELKLLAINSLLNQDPERAVPLLEKLLETGSVNCPKARKQALFVLAQSGTPRARTVMEKVERGQVSPDLQREAINNLGIFGGHESRAVLKSIYESSSDNNIKKKILQSFMVSGEKEFLLSVARNEKDPELRSAAVQQLGVMGAREELWQMYQQETAIEVKAKIINAMFVGGDADHMIQLAKSEKDASLRMKAINNLGLMGSKRSGDALVELYSNEKDTSVRKAVLNAFFLQGNARQLIEVARKETDPELKRAAVQKLSLMGSKEAMDFLMEILNKP